jgi:hypothetical protein
MDALPPIWQPRDHHLVMCHGFQFANCYFTRA